MTAVPVIAIDGPTASGKGTIAERVADALQFHYLDSGALYRLVGLQALEVNVDADDESELTEIATRMRPTFAAGRITLDGRDVTDAIRAEAVSRLASRVAVHPAVRQALLELQRSRRQPPGLVADGRDMGTVVFPDAALKIYLTASLPARADRRHKQLIEKGFSATMPALSQDIERKQIEQEILSRDQRDVERSASPLFAAEDACLIDSSELSVEEVVALVMNLTRERLPRAQ